MTNKHTQGEWVNNQQGAIEAQDRVICRVMDGYTTQAMKESMANANLIAAAPDLLAALERVIEFHVPKFNPLSDAAILSAQAVVARVRGE